MQSHQAHEDNGEVRDCGTFLLDVAGQFSPQQVKVHWCDEHRATNGQVDRLIEEIWTAEMDRAARDGHELFNGPACRLIEYEANGQELTLSLGPVSFKELLGTNLLNPAVGRTHGPEVLADALGASAAVTTNDNFLLLGRRSRKVIFHAGRIHPIGGMVEPSSEPNAAPDVFAGIVRELTEETMLSSDQVREIFCIGLVREKPIVQPELIFDVAADVDLDTLLRVAADAVDAKEHAEFVPIENRPGPARDFIEQSHMDLTPVARATLLLHGLQSWGTDWFDAMRSYLRSVA